VRHVGSLHRVAAEWVREGRRPTGWATDPEVGDNLAAWARRGSADMLKTLTRVTAEPLQRYCAHAAATRPKIYLDGPGPSPN
jgi:hypothetical protein